MFGLSRSLTVFASLCYGLIVSGCKTAVSAVVTVFKKYLNACHVWTQERVMEHIKAHPHGQCHLPVCCRGCVILLLSQQMWSCYQQDRCTHVSGRGTMLFARSP